MKAKLSKKPDLFFTSDQHYFHDNIIKYCKRPFGTHKDMNEQIVKNHNNTVKPNDIVVHIGDITAGLKGRVDEFKEIFGRLNGKHYLIRGNHDHLKDAEYIEMGFTGVSEYLEMDDWFVCHYPLNMQVRADWINADERRLNEVFKKSKCTKIIHGHSHITDFGLHRFNASVDMNEFSPVHSTKIAEEFENIHLRKERKLF